MAQVAAGERAASSASSVANPAPLGLCGFALTTFVLSAANAGLFTGAEIVVGLALFYGGVAQFAAGMWEFKSGNTFGATAFASYGAFWLAVAAMLILKLIPNGTAFGFFLLGWTIFTALMFLGTLRANVALMLVFGFLTLTFLVLAIGAFAGAAGITAIGGWLGIITALLAWYTAVAQVLTSVNSTIVLPLGPRS
jgi:succinate-acetate transporter protein